MLMNAGGHYRPHEVRPQQLQGKPVSSSTSRGGNTPTPTGSVRLRGDTCKKCPAHIWQAGTPQSLGTACGDGAPWTRVGTTHTDACKYVSPSGWRATTLGHTRGRQGCSPSPPSPPSTSCPQHQLDGEEGRSQPELKSLGAPTRPSHPQHQDLFPGMAMLTGDTTKGTTSKLRQDPSPVGNRPQRGVPGREEDREGPLAMKLHGPSHCWAPRGHGRSREITPQKGPRLEGWSPPVTSPQSRGGRSPG